jgi:negative regulator of flagellin synthesis FlgM
MAININNLQNTPIKQKIDQQAQVKQQANQNSVSAQQNNLASRDSVSITPQAKQLDELQKKAQEAPVINQQKIEQLKKAIASGEYKINPERLAASIANFEFKLA